MEVNLPGAGTLTVLAPGASEGKMYVCGLSVNGERRREAVVSHADIKDGGELVFEMSGEPCVWASGTLQG